MSGSQIWPRENAMDGSTPLLGVIAGAGATWLATEREHKHQRELQSDSIKRQAYIDYVSALDVWRAVVQRLHSKSEEYVSDGSQSSVQGIKEALASLHDNRAAANRAWRRLQLNADREIITAGKSSNSGSVPIATCQT